MTKSSFIHTEHDIGECWCAQLRKSMTEAGKEESKLAIERNDYHQGVPAITVYVDGGEGGPSDHISIVTMLIQV